MIRDLELRLAEVLGERLPAPFGGHVEAAPVTGTPGGSPRVVVGAVLAEREPGPLGGDGPRVVPGDALPRRVLRARVQVDVRVEAADAAGREQQLAGLDALAYAVDDPGFRAALDPAPGTDPGFLLDSLDVVAAAFPFAPEPVGAAVTLSALGSFWPVGTVGATGPSIVEVRVRAGLAPVEVVFPADPFLAGGPPGVLTLRTGAVGSLALSPAGPGTEPFGRLALRLARPGGKPGAGLLTGGAPGATPDIRLVDLTGGSATVTYTPPAEPGRDLLVVALDDAAGGASAELDRVPLEVR